MDAGQGSRLVASLQATPPWGHPSDHPGLIETHLSWVLLAGAYAYKIKKPVDFGFVDFTTLPLRRHFIEEELRLNRRYASGWYLAVVPFYGTPERPSLTDDGGAPFEYALKMRRFPQSALLSAVTRDVLDEAAVERLADQVAAFHRAPDTAVAPAASSFGSPATVAGVIEGNFAQTRPLLSDPSLFERLALLHDRELRRFDAYRGVIERRKTEGHIRELHGDLHRGNIALINGAPLLFDALEFNPSLRWIDPMAEIAFLVMDFYAADLPWAARLFLNRYLERTGDYDGVPLLPLYLCYRAMVRAKVALLSRSVGEPGNGPCMTRFLAYLSLAERLGAPRGTAKVFMTCGLSGSGKSRFTRKLIPLLDAIRVRSDRERVRLFPERQGRYRESATEQVYHRLREAAGSILDAGYHAVVDAAFLSGRQRRAYMDWADERGVEVTLLNFADPGEAAVVRRLAARDADDPSEATPEVVALQREQRDPLTEEELRRAFPVNETTPPEELLAWDCGW